MRVHRLAIKRFRGIADMTLHPGDLTVLIGPNSAGKSTILEALDLLLHPGYGRPRQAPDELDYYGRDPSQGFTIEAVLGELDEAFSAEARDHLEGWRATECALDDDPDGADCEPVVRVRVTGTPDFDLSHEFAKHDSAGARFGPRLRAQVGWFFDGRDRDPAWQMVFHRGGVLDRLFRDADLALALDDVRGHLRSGAETFATASAVSPVLDEVGDDLSRLQLLEALGGPGFELGSVSDRALLQTLQLTLPTSAGPPVPLRRHGRGIQRLMLVAALLRLAARDHGHAPIAGFEEPEEALEPLRQAQIAAMIQDITEKGGQAFVVTHSPEIVRAFKVDDLHLVSSSPRGVPHSLGTKLSARAKQGYERRLDSSTVQALFSRIPVLVEGPSDRAAFCVFWDALAKAGRVAPRHACALDFINCEGASHQPEVARLLHEANKTVVAWVETDRTDTLDRLRANSHCAAIIAYPPDGQRRNLEEALSRDCRLEALGLAMTQVAEARGYDAEAQQEALLRYMPDEAPQEQRESVRTSATVTDALTTVPEPLARCLALRALAPKNFGPFETKGARPARLLAEVIVDHDDVPTSFATAMVGLGEWIAEGCPSDPELSMP